MKKLLKQTNLTLNNQDGFTIIESLLAIIVVGILMTAVAPVIAFSVANRVQAQRVETATNAAKAFIEGIRNGNIPAFEGDPDAIPPVPAKLNLSATTFDNESAPSKGTLNCPNDRDFCKSPATLYCINGDETAGCQIDSFKDMIVQPHGYHPDGTTADPEDGYVLGLRIYRADAFGSSGTLETAKGAGGVESSVTGGTGLRDEQAPLLEQTTTIATDETQFSDLCDRINKQNTGGIDSACD
ncbi:MAG: hormogonium polysaccharide secretion pseudopilin HpsB [Spirulinaceae cyanobacterium]